MNNSTQQVVTRIAPSPTGLFHIGTARTALISYLYAMQHTGRFLVRIEDTDKGRSKQEYTDNILEGLAWLNIKHEAPVYQSACVEAHTQALDTLIASDQAYVSKEPAKEDSERTVEVVRLRNAGKVVTFTDEIRGEITFDTTELGDFVIARSRTDPLYHLAVVVDDAAMQVTHVIRGEDHISNTPRQILIQEALGYTRPIYAHLPLILAPDKSKLSKRKGAVSVSEYQAQGILPETLINYLALLGWNPGTDQEVFTFKELIKQFSFTGVQKGGAVFDMEKLKWLNREHRARLPRKELVAHTLKALVGHDALVATVSRCDRAFDDMLERFSLQRELQEAVDAGEFSFYETRPTVAAAGLVWKKDPAPERVREHLMTIRFLVKGVDAKTFNYDAVKSVVWPYAEEEGRGSVLWPLRFALSGKDRSPDPFLLLEALGKDESLARIEAAVALLS